MLGRVGFLWTYPAESERIDHHWSLAMRDE